MKTFLKRTASIAAVLMSSTLVGACSRVPSNVHTLSSTNCGAKWTKLMVGETVPAHAGNPCGYTVAIPNWPMPGDAKFKTQFAKGVLSDARISYTYIIIDPLLFIENARYLGKMGGSLEISAESVGGRYEIAENILIDKLLREETTELTRNLDVVGANPVEMLSSSESRVSWRRGGLLFLI